ncbi:MULTISPECIES: contractile injection system tape measure protein [Candidatus Fukatsuia]|uniref:Uncharacterized protein n=1 Tax=Candidatus Fukatsuia symbiotica TaxID=1878942 RepID=A0A2U8I7G4_9GAMM|nr:contractile injection system tape measure protein [Candidatus Fukatsuia symbiotica]AWK15100.1 hypothetical protein CCS41_12470 [Candidatus Fukatsuia symbiotica]
MPTHLIQCQTWIVHLSSQQPSWAIKNTLSQWARVQLPPILAKICDEQIEANQWYSLDKVELDLGVITLPAEPQQVIEQIATAFSQALAKQLQNFRPAAIMKRDENAQALRTLDYFIKTGTRPWWVSKDTVALTQCLLRLIDRTPARLREKLCHYLAQAATLQRLIAQCSDDQLLALSRLLAQNDHVELWCQQISAPLHRAFTREQFAAMALRSAYWQAILITSEMMSRVKIDKTAFYKHVLLHLATHCQLNYHYLLVRLFATLKAQEKIADPWPTLLPEQHGSPSTREKNDVNVFINEAIYEQLLTQLQILRAFCTAKNKQPSLSYTHTPMLDIARQTGLISKVDRLVDVIMANKKRFSEHPQTREVELNRFRVYLNKIIPQLGISLSETLAHLPYHRLVTLQQTLKELDTFSLMRKHHVFIRSIMEQIKPNVSNQVTLRHQEGKIAALIPPLRQLLSRLQQEITKAEHQSTSSKRVDKVQHERLLQGTQPIPSITVADCGIGQSEQCQKSQIASLIPHSEKASLNDLKEKVTKLRKHYGRLYRQYQALLTLTGQTATVKAAKHDVANLILSTPSLQPVTAMINTLSVVLKKQQQAHQAALMLTKTISQSLLLAREADIDQHEDIYVDNAGLALLGIYLKPFFTTAHLLQGDHFIDHLAARRAALLLQYLMTSQSICFEETLTFNKLLCGLNLQVPIERTIEVNVAEQAACDQLFAQVKTQWPVMTHLSNSYLIQHFLMRQGVIRNHPYHWQLQIERTSHDVLMKGITWPINLIQLPWLDKPIQVDW